MNKQKLIEFLEALVSSNQEIIDSGNETDNIECATEIYTLNYILDQINKGKFN